MKVTLSYSAGGQLMQNAWDVLDGALTPSEVAEAFENEYWVGNLRAQTSWDVRLDEIAVSDPVLPVLRTVATDGTKPLSALPSNCAVLATKVPTGAGRPGRIFHPGVGESEVDSAGRLSSGATQAYQTAFSNALTDLATAGVDLAVENHTPGAPGGDYTLYGLVLISVRPIIGSMPQRMR